MEQNGFRYRVGEVLDGDGGSGIGGGGGDWHLDLDHFFDIDPSYAERFRMNIDSLIRIVVDRSQGSLSVLRTRNCSDATLSFVTQRCPNLEVLSIQSSPGVTDESIAQISSNCVNLRELDLSYYYNISYESLVRIGQNCPNLTVLKRNWLDPNEHFEIDPNGDLAARPMDWDSEATAIGEYMPNLVHLEIRFSGLTMRGLEVLFRGCQNLVHLDL